MSMAVAQAGVQEHGRGHIGLVVVGSIAGGLILGLMLVLGVFGGGQESVIFLGLPWQHTRGSALLGFVKVTQTLIHVAQIPQRAGMSKDFHGTNGSRRETLIKKQNGDVQHIYSSRGDGAVTMA